MKRPFPVRRSDTITRANIELVFANAEIDPAKIDPAKIDAVYLAGHFKGPTFKARHVNRCHRLMPTPAPVEVIQS